jgi:hypothetical protein
MTNNDKIERIALAVAMAGGRPGGYNSTDKDFAANFVAAWEEMKKLEGPTPRGPITTNRG